MPITLITAQPRTGKTLLMMEMLVAAMDANRAVKKSGKGVYRPLFALGVDGLDVTQCGYEADEVTILRAGAYERKDMAAIALEGRQWEDCPDDSIIYVDEAWKWFGDVTDARSVKRPDYVVGLAEHGHRGIDFVWTTQTTMQLFSFARGVMGNHTHMLRHLGAPLCTLYQWSEMCEDVKSQTQRDRSISKKWVYPRKLYKIYKSASNHHVKVSVPWRMFLIPICVFAAVGLGWLAYVKMKSYGTEQEERITVAGGVAAAPGSTGQPPKEVGKDKERKPLTPAEWVERITPRFAGVHGSQPIFDGRKVKSEPATYCVISGNAGASECRCYTEQVTVIEGVAPGVCESMAMRGQYDPFREPFQRGERPEFAAVPPQDGSQDTGTGITLGGVANGSALQVASPGMGYVQGVSP